MSGDPILLADRTHIVAAYSRRTRLPLLLTKLMTSGDIWSHCGVVAHCDEANCLVVVEALAFKGVVKTPVDVWKERYPAYDFVSFDCPRPQDGERFALEQVGKGYDYLGMLGAPWRFEWNDPNLWYCSELVEACIKEAGRDRWREGKRGVRPMESYLVK